MLTDRMADMWQTIQLAVLAAVVVAPMWIFANELSGDEFVKSAVGLSAGVVVVTALRIIESRLKGD
jgi:hypothetical protein